MKVKLIEYFINLNNKLKEYKDFNNDSFSSTIEDKANASMFYEDELVDRYCEFINIYSYFCDVVIDDSNDRDFISQCMIFYYMMNKEYFDSKSEEEDIKNIQHIINQLEPHKEILNYEFEYESDKSEKPCELCNNEGDIPDCLLCGRPADINDEKEIKRNKYKIN